MKFLNILLAVSLNLVFSLTPTFAEEITVYEEDLKLGGDHNDAIEVTISKESLGQPRIESELIIDFDNLPHVVDSKMKALGNMGSCSRRVYWAGNTKVKGRGETLQLSSRVRYEQWACSKIFGNWLRTRIFRDTKTVLWSLFLDWKEEPVVTAQVDNIKNFPDWVEEKLSLRHRKDLRFKIPRQCGACSCSDVKAELKPKLDSVSFSGASQEVTLKASISFNNLSIGEITKCLSQSS